MTLPAYMFRDPAEVYEQTEARSCKGCAHTDVVFGKTICKKGKGYGRRCKHYAEEAIRGEGGRRVWPADRD